jgi:hypothetical protein
VKCDKIVESVLPQEDENPDVDEHHADQDDRLVLTRAEECSAEGLARFLTLTAYDSAFLTVNLFLSAERASGWRRGTRGGAGGFAELPEQRRINLTPWA